MSSLAQHFYDVIAIAETIKQAIRIGRTLQPIKKKNFTRKKKDSKVNNLEEGYNDKKKNLSSL